MHKTTDTSKYWQWDIYIHVNIILDVSQPFARHTYMEELHPLNNNIIINHS